MLKKNLLVHNMYVFRATGVNFGLLIFRLTFLKPSSIYIFNMLKCAFILDYIIGNENTTK